MDVDPAATCGGFNCRFGALTHPAKSWFCLVFRVYGVSKIDRLIGGQLSHQVLIEGYELSLLIFIGDTRQGPLVLTRLRSGLPTHLCSPSFKGQGAFSTQ